MSILGHVCDKRKTQVGHILLTEMTSYSPSNRFALRPMHMFLRPA
jgi:hypothetical protein